MKMQIKVILVGVLFIGFYFQSNLATLLASEPEVNIVDGAFSIGKCVSKATKYFPNKSRKDLNKLCCEAYRDYLFTKSKKQGEAVSGKYTDGYCTDEWLSYPKNKEAK